MTRLSSPFFTSPTISRIRSGVSFPSLLSSLILWAWDTVGAIWNILFREERPLFRYRQEGYLISRVEREFSFIEFVQQVRDQFRKLEIALNLFGTLAGLIPDELYSFPARIWVVVLATFSSAASALQSIVLHFVGKGFFAGEQAVPVQVGIDHPDHGVIIPKDTNDDRQLAVSQLYGRVFPAVTGDDLVYAFGQGTDDQGIQDPVFADTVNEQEHLLVFDDLEGVVAEVSQAFHLDLDDPFVFINCKRQALFLHRWYFYYAKNIPVLWCQ